MRRWRRQIIFRPPVGAGSEALAAPEPIPSDSERGGSAIAYSESGENGEGNERWRHSRLAQRTVMRAVSRTRGDGRDMSREVFNAEVEYHCR